MIQRPGTVYETDAQKKKRTEKEPLYEGDPRDYKYPYGGYPGYGYGHPGYGHPGYGGYGHPGYAGYGHPGYGGYGYGGHPGYAGYGGYPGYAGYPDGRMGSPGRASVKVKAKEWKW